MGCDYRRSIIDVGLQPALDLKSVIGFWPIDSRTCCVD